jgi:predicted nucleic acid-binding protein
MSGPILADAGPLISFLVQTTEHHRWACEQMARFRPPLLTCEPVLAETEYLLRRQKLEVRPLLELLERGVLQVAFNLQEELLAVKALVSRYANVPMSLADACLVRMSETRNQATVWTLEKDFRIYRRHGRLVISALFPPGT